MSLHGKNCQDNCWQRGDIALQLDLLAQGPGDLNSLPSPATGSWCNFGLGHLTYLALVFHLPNRVSFLYYIFFIKFIRLYFINLNIN